jgi:NADH:ubiquinone oxidoreductase subunit D
MAEVLERRMNTEIAPLPVKTVPAEKVEPNRLRTEEMVLNVGPQHPSTHGVLRLEAVLDGELVIDVVPYLGYLHRCFEKHSEAMTYPQVIPYVDRMDYLAAMKYPKRSSISVFFLQSFSVSLRTSSLSVRSVLMLVHSRPSSIASVTAKIF